MCSQSLCALGSQPEDSPSAGATQWGVCLGTEDLLISPGMKGGSLPTIIVLGQSSRTSRGEGPCTDRRTGQTRVGSKETQEEGCDPAMAVLLGSIFLLF